MEEANFFEVYYEVTFELSSSKVLNETMCFQTDKNIRVPLVSEVL